MILADNPIEHGEKDLLRRGPLALRVSELIKDYQGEESVVIGIEGPWGSGKTSFVNLVLGELKKENLSIIVSFNPWNFSGQNELIVDFFSTLLGQIEEEIGKDYFKTIKSYASKLGSSISPSIGVGPASISLGSFWSPKKKSLSEERKEIDKKLKTLTKKIVVVIDDIDRLDKRETRLIMKLVKMTANFPKTVFLLAYDRKRVADRLQEDGWPGEEFLKKIIQVSFTLPEPDRQGLNRVLFNDLDESIKMIYGDVVLEGENEKRWGEFVYHGFPMLFKTIRDIKRYSSSLRLNWSIIGKEEVNMVDFMGIEVIRVFAPSFYATIGANKSFFTGAKSLLISSYSRDDSATKQKKYAEMLEQVPADIMDTIKKLCESLFPQLDSHSNYGGDWNQGWRKDKRICSEERFDFYFQLGIPVGAISETEIKEVVESTSNKDVFKEQIIRFKKDGRTKALLSKLMDHLSDITPEQSKNLILGLWESREIIGEDRSGVFDFDDTQTKVGRLAYHSLKESIVPEKRKEFLEDLVKSSNNLYQSVRFIATLLQGAEKDSQMGDTTIVSAEDIEPSKQYLLSQIKKFAEDDSLLKNEDLAFFLYRWKEWESKEAVQSYVNKLISTKQGVINLLRGFTSKVYSTAGDYFHLDKKGLSEFISIENLDQAISLITKEDIAKMSEEERRAFDLYSKPSKRDR